MSYEAIAYVRRRGTLAPAELKWTTVDSRDQVKAREAYEDLNLEVIGAVRVLDQGVASALAEKI